MTPTAPPTNPVPDGSRNENPPGIGILRLLAEDFRTHDSNPLEQGFWAVAVHRFGNWRMGIRRPFRPFLTVAYSVLYRCVEWTCGISLPYTTKLGRRVRLWHHSGMILRARSIGDDVHIRQNTTFGIARRDRVDQIPTIGDRVDIGCGVCILGGVEVGADSVIGANAVVVSDVPPWSVAAGVPARVVKTLAPAATSGARPGAGGPPTESGPQEAARPGPVEAARPGPPAPVSG